MSIESTIIAEIKAYVVANFNGDFHAAFFQFAPTGTANEAQIRAALTVAGVGNIVSRRFIAADIVNRYGSDEEITWDQAQAAAGQITEGEET